MATPQCENGYTKLANELLDALVKIRVPGEAMQILLTVIRKTYGFHKKEDAISLSQFNLATGIVKPSIVRAIRQLESMNLISKKANKSIATYRFNKDYSTWKPLAKKLTVSKNANSRLRKSKSALAKKLPTKDIITKDTFTKDIYVDSFNKFWNIYPSRNGKKLEKEEAFKRFREFKKEEIPLILQASQNYAQSEMVKKGIGIRDPKRFLKNGQGNAYWKEWIKPEQKQDLHPKSLDASGRELRILPTGEPR